MKLKEETHDVVTHIRLNGFRHVIIAYVTFLKHII